MKRTMMALILILGLAAPAAANRDEGMMKADYFFLPQGDAARGREAFLKLKCQTCHAVEGEKDFTVPVAEKAGPVLGTRQARYSPGWLADAIVSPSHTIAAGSGGKSESGNLSRMGDFKDAMTVGEMIDLIAYIRSLEDAAAEYGEEADHDNS